MKYFYTPISYIILNMLMPNIAYAQNCKVFPNCQNLGYIRTAGTCPEGVTEIPCPLNAGYVFCPEDCRNYTLTEEQCDNTKGVCSQCFFTGKWKYSACYPGWYMSNKSCVENACDGYNITSPTISACSDVSSCKKGAVTYYKCRTCYENYALSDGSCVFQTKSFEYTGGMQSVTLTAGTYKLEVWGAQGGYRSSASYGGKGGYATGILTVTSEATIYVFVGGAGNTGSLSGSIYTGGYNGGGYRYQYPGGGGATDMRIGYDSLYARVIVAGGGGSDGASSYGGGYGGGTSGARGSGGCCDTYCGYGGTGTGTSSGTTIATQGVTNSQDSSPAGFGFGGFGVYRSSGYGGAGGGGWYGGQGVYPDGSVDDDYGGGGGSGYVYTSATASSYPSGCLLDSSHYLTSASTVAGNASMPSPEGSTETGHSGNGYARITRQ